MAHNDCVESGCQQYVCAHMIVALADARAEINTLKNGFNDALTAVTLLDKEVIRLRAALEEIIRVTQPSAIRPHPKAYDIARAALEAKP